MDVGSARVAIVDDDASFQALMSLVLIDQGYTPVHLSFDELYDSINQTAPIDDMILLDIFDGREPVGLHALRTIRSNPATQDLPVIVVSAMSNATLEEQVRPLATAMIAKPFDLDDMLALIQQTMAGRLRPPSESDQDPTPHEPRGWLVADAST